MLSGSGARYQLLCRRICLAACFPARFSHLHRRRDLVARDAPDLHEHAVILIRIRSCVPILPHSGCRSQRRTRPPGLVRTLLPPEQAAHAKGPHTARRSAAIILSCASATFNSSLTPRQTVLSSASKKQPGALQKTVRGYAALDASLREAVFRCLLWHSSAGRLRREPSSTLPGASSGSSCPVCRAQPSRSPVRTDPRRGRRRFFSARPWAESVGSARKASAP